MCKCLYNKKCNYCSEKSIELDLCINCNKEDGYYQKSDEDMTSEGFINCYKEPEGYYLENNLYQKCNESCKYCSTLGNQNDQKCLECYENYTLINDFDNFSNCYPNCDYYYYYNMENNNNYECTSENKCPEKYSKIIKKKKRCINECYNDNIYKYEYNNECYEKCPKETVLSFNISYLCQNLLELQKYKSESVMFEKILNISSQEISIDTINNIASEYVDNVANYTNFVSKMVSEDYKIYIYKNSSALEETEEQAPQIDFGECYDKVKKYYNINQDLLVTLISNETDKSIYGKASNKYTFSSPETGKVLDTTGICNEKDKIIVQESIKTLMENIDDKKKEYINYLVNQGIDVFDLSNIFYNELCYYFESPNKKDVPLKDRYLSFYPNVTLCDRGCDIKGIDLDKKRAKCECSFNNFLNNDIVGNIKVGVLSDTFDILNSLNINVFKCFLDIFKPKNFIKCIGGFLFSACLIIQIICVVKFLSNGLYYIRKYIISLSESFNLYKSKTNIKNPPKRRQRSKTTKKIILIKKI